MTSIMLLIVSVTLIAISLRDIHWASKQHLQNKIDTSCDTILSAKDAKELTDECNRKIIEAQFNDIMICIKEQCNDGKNRLVRFTMLPEVKEKLEHLEYEVETVYDNSDDIVTDPSTANYIIKWGKEEDIK